MKRNLFFTFCFLLCAYVTFAQQCPQSLNIYFPEAVNFNENIYPHMMADVNGDGREDVVFFGYNNVSVALGKTDGTFMAPQIAINNYTAGHGWSDMEKYPRFLADINGDGKADILGFGNGHVWVSLSTSSQTTASFRTAQGVLSDFTPVQSWWDNNTYPRYLADVNGDGKADIIGFGNGAVKVSLSSSTNTIASFRDPQTVIYNFTTGQSWWDNNTYPRLMTDVNGDGKADIIGFGNGSVYVSLSTSTSTSASFRAPQFVLDEFTTGQQWWNNSTHPRFMADVNGDGKDDIIGFGGNGVYVSLSTATQTSPSFLSMQFTSVRTYTVYGGYVNNNVNPRFVKDIDGDGKADIVGFIDYWMEVAFSLSSGNNVSYKPALRIGGAYGSNMTSQKYYPRLIADINGDGHNDVIGFQQISTDKRYHNIITFTCLGSYKNWKNVTAYKDISLSNYEGYELHSEDINIYPNPTDGTLNIQSYKEMEIVEIYDIYGRLVLKESIDGTNNFLLNLSEYSNGMYVVKILDENNNLSIKTINIIK